MIDSLCIHLPFIITLVVAFILCGLTNDDPSAFDLSQHCSLEWEYQWLSFTSLLFFFLLFICHLFIIYQAWITVFLRTNLCLIFFIYLRAILLLLQVIVASLQTYSLRTSEESCSASGKMDKMVVFLSFFWSLVLITEPFSLLFCLPSPFCYCAHSLAIPLLPPLCCSFPSSSFLSSSFVFLFLLSLSFFLRHLSFSLCPLSCLSFSFSLSPPTPLLSLLSSILLYPSFSEWWPFLRATMIANWVNVGFNLCLIFLSFDRHGTESQSQLSVESQQGEDWWTIVRVRLLLCSCCWSESLTDFGELVEPLKVRRGEHRKVK